MGDYSQSVATLNVAGSKEGATMLGMKSLKELEGTTVAMHIPIFHPTIFQNFTLHKVEDVGIWIESQAATS